MNTWDKGNVSSEQSSSILLVKNVFMKKETKYRVIGKGNKCLGCGEIMERREHSEKPKKTWHYTKWDICRNNSCKSSVQHYDEFKSHEWKLHEAGLDKIY